MTRRYVRHLDDGRPAIPTSIEFLITIDALAAGVAEACLERSAPPRRRFAGRVRHNPMSDESYWDEADLRRARRAADNVGRGMVMGAVRSAIRDHGRSWQRDDFTDLWNRFPESVARRRAGELWPDLDPTMSPFGRPAEGHDES